MTKSATRGFPLSFSSRCAVGAESDDALRGRSIVPGRSISAIQRPPVARRATAHGMCVQRARVVNRERPQRSFSSGALRPPLQQ